VKHFLYFAAIDFVNEQVRSTLIFVTQPLAWPPNVEIVVFVGYPDKEAWANSPVLSTRYNMVRSPEEVV
jgi:hypothetical protein